MDNKAITIAGILLIVSTILFDFIFVMGSEFTLNVTSAFLLGVLNMMALHFIRVIFNFKLQKETEFIVLIPTIVVSIKKVELVIVFLNRTLEVSLKYKELSKPTITKA